MAYHNALTQLHNGCSFEENLIKSLNAIGEYNRQLSVIIIDLNGFRKLMIPWVMRLVFCCSRK